MSSARTRGTGSGAGRSGAAAVDAKVQRRTCDARREYYTNDCLEERRKTRRREKREINHETIGEQNIQNMIHFQYYGEGLW